MLIVIGFGGNLGKVEQTFHEAVCALKRSPELDIRKKSSLYRSKPVGPAQPDFLNAAILVEADMHPLALLDRCLEIEKKAGRDRSTEFRWGPRCLDLDLLIADQLVCREPDLEIPHPRLAERAFALVPAAEMVPDWVHPILGLTLAELAATVSSGDPGALEDISSRW